MSKRLKRLTAAALCVLTLALATPTAHGSTVYFMAVNDTPLELSASNMPTVSRGVLYVPLNMFSTDFTGVNLGVYALYNSAQGRALVYSKRRQLIFDIQNNTTYDVDGNTYRERAMIRNSTVYLPIDLVCSMFSDIIWYTRNFTQYGQLIRLKNSSVVLGDAAYISAASNRMRDSLNSYLESLPSQAQPSASPSPPEPSESPQVSGGAAGVYLAFTLPAAGQEDRSSALGQTLDALDALDCRGLFFLTADEILEQDDLVRRLVGSGHLVGVRFTAGSGDEALSELEDARRNLARTARCRAAVALAEALDEDALGQLKEAGLVFWQTTADARRLRGDGAARAAALLPGFSVGRAERNRLLLDAGAGSTLSSLLSAITAADFELRTPVPTEL